MSDDSGTPSAAADGSAVTRSPKSGLSKEELVQVISAVVVVVVVVVIVVDIVVIVVLVVVA
jgi:hypothetical protein